MPSTVSITQIARRNKALLVVLVIFAIYIAFTARPSVTQALSHLSPTKPGSSTNQIPKTNPLSSASGSDALVVDLGYELYRGYAVHSGKVNVFRGVRYAAPPTGKLRWQPPQHPSETRDRVWPADDFGPMCVQSQNAHCRGSECAPSSSRMPKAKRTDHILSKRYDDQDEDCLFLNVYAPAGKWDLPVLVWTHGGGYGAGTGNDDPSNLIRANDYGFIAVHINYRLGAFGFLSSDEVARFGTPNVGLLDQHFALQWVQQHIYKFGGDPSRVTFGGQSAGGGSVMLQDMAYGGEQGTALFNQILPASPYLPNQYNYNDWVPTQNYLAFAHEAGCFNGEPHNVHDPRVFDCLVAADSQTLRDANAAVNNNGIYATWAFLPVTDGTFVQSLPSQQLAAGRVNAERILTGYLTNEGPAFTPMNVHTQDDFGAYLYDTLALFTDNDRAKLETYYPPPDSSSSRDTSFSSSNTTNADDGPVSSLPLFATSGTTFPFATTHSSFATGQQQRAINLYAEETFVCPTYWLADAHAARPYISTTSSASVTSSSPDETIETDATASTASTASRLLSRRDTTPGRGRPQAEDPPRAKAWLYHYAALPARHGGDLPAWFGTYAKNEVISEPFSLALMRAWGNFVIYGDPNGPKTEDRNGNRNGEAVAADASASPEMGTYWPPYTPHSPAMMNLNQTGGHLAKMHQASQSGFAVDVDVFVGDGMEGEFTVVDAWEWEGGRGGRCDFWRGVGGRVPM
ncbi:hypothetical protein MRB53_037528 [Persea americana]|nr:hypothetical protein MRB53_037528 [Persea americana]